MTHLWVRAEQRPNEERVGLTPLGAARLIAAGMKVSVEESAQRKIAIDGYAKAGCEIVAENAWPGAPADAIIFGLKELPDDDTPLSHRHIMFGHAFKGQHAGRRLLGRFAEGGGTLYDLEYLLDEDGRRVAAFGYWAGYSGAAVSLKAWAAQEAGGICHPVSTYADKQALVEELRAELAATARPLPHALVIGALGRVGTGAADLCAELGMDVTRWDMAETASGGPFPEILQHDIFLNCIFARPGTPVFVGPDALTAPRRLSVIGDIACDPDSDYNPVPIYTEATSWQAPVVRVADTPPLDVMAIDNLPSLLPVESSEDYAAQLLPSLLTLDRLETGVWGRAKATFDAHMKGI
ncbi:saccharopine dehydrogenase [Sinisalibacter aestuarii]|uniref:Saccharopine dehydrogenase [NAD(+), L-lysine-forming] n=1 Tax=Sinisalibacter aestuarii TaxID=2949426 RepID=A0ABQ5LRB4_9RHOB|nr:saccharopine dehydrogenase [Sinisalibacter aestuarii]GKY86801.1 saccharopine dehydrogenase [Sinisalibacter aestuarii]